MNQTTQPARKRNGYRRLLGASGAALLPLLALIVLFNAKVPLGQPDFLVYRYSPWWLLRLNHVWFALAFGSAGMALLWLGLWGKRQLQPLMIGGAALAYVLLAGWTLWAPPIPVDQHLVNLVSPSHDGAFVQEGCPRGVPLPSIRTYVSETFYEHLERDPHEMQGRRVLSNPPGVTVVAILAQRLINSSPRLQQWFIDTFDLDQLDDAWQQPLFAAMLLLAFAFTVVWALSLWPAYLLCRLWMPRLAAVTVAFACVFNPATVNFTPGKDPAQLFTILLLMWTWLTGYVRMRAGWTFAAGAILAVATMIGLVHLWVLAILVVATCGHALHRAEQSRLHALRSWFLKCFLPAGAGGLVVALLAYVTLDWNIIYLAVRVGVRYHQIQLPVITDPFGWTLVGLPLFLLFVGPLFWAQVLALRVLRVERPAVLGGWLLGVTLLVLVYTYFGANNSETPRLWMAFIPLLLLPLALRRAAFTHDSLSHRRLCMLLLALQLVITVVHWSLMDVRESEHRISTKRMWD